MEIHKVVCDRCKRECILKIDNFNRSSKYPDDWDNVKLGDIRHDICPECMKLYFNYQIDFLDYMKLEGEKK